MSHPKLSLQRSIFTVAACAVLPMLLSNVRSQEIVNIENVPGRGIDENWYRYVNTRYRFEIDIPATGLVYEMSAYLCGWGEKYRRIWIPRCQFKRDC